MEIWLFSGAVTALVFVVSFWYGYRCGKADGLKLLYRERYYQKFRDLQIKHNGQ